MDPIFDFENPITENGDYNITGLQKGVRYQITAKDTYGGGNIVLKADDGPGGAFVPMQNSTLDTDNDWLQFDANTPNLRLTVADATDPELQITLVRLF
jgi:hypothetical protein